MKRFIALLGLFALVGFLNLSAQTQKDGNIGSSEVRGYDEADKELMKALVYGGPISTEEVYSDGNKVVSELYSIHKLYERQGKLKEFNKYIKKYYKKNKKDAAKITGIAMWYYPLCRQTWNTTTGGRLERVSPLKDAIGKDSILAYKYINRAIKVDNKYMPAYVYGGEVQRVNGNIDAAIEWYRNGINASPEYPECYAALAKLYVLMNDTAKALSMLDEMECMYWGPDYYATRARLYLLMNDAANAESELNEMTWHASESLTNQEVARWHYANGELAYAFDRFEKSFWADSTKRSHFTETDYLKYMVSAEVTYNLTYGRYLKNLKAGAKMVSTMQNLYNTAILHTKRSYNVASYGLGLYPENKGLIRYAFYLAQRLEMNDRARVYAEKLFSMYKDELIIDDYLTYAKLYAAMGDLASADKMYKEAYAMCMTQTDETRKESENIESASSLKFLQCQLDILKNYEYVIMKEHTRLYSQDYEKKIGIAQYYIDRKKSVNRTDYVDELNQLGTALAAKAQSVDSTKMVDVWKQVDSVYAEMAEISPNEWSQKIISKNANGITFVVDEGLETIKIDRKLSNGEMVAMDLLDSSFESDGCYIDKSNIVATSFAKDQNMLTFYDNDRFYWMIVNAYAKHQSLVLSPDMIWLLISQGFARYVNAHSEELRSKLVSFDGKKELVVKTGSKPNWDVIVASFSDSIRQYTKGDIAQTLMANFSTTTVPSRTASGITLMECVKKYFDYRVFDPICGIPSITLQGNPEDWQLVLDKARSLEQYGLGKWIKELEPILTEFVLTAEGSPNQRFWQCIVKKNRVAGLKRGCSPNNKPTMFDGWFLKLFPDEQGLTRDSIALNKNMPADHVKVDFLFEISDGRKTISTTKMRLWAGFIGAEVDSITNTLTPKIGWLVYKKNDKR